MTDYPITVRGHTAYVTIGGHDVMLICRYIQGDYDSPTEPESPEMHSALYDLYQITGAFAKGDTFSFDGKPLYVCEGVHVCRIE